MDNSPILKVENVLLTRRGHHVRGTLALSRFHLVFSCRLETGAERPREIWLCYPIIERISKARGSFWSQSLITDQESCDKPNSIFADFDKYAASHIRLVCKDFTYYLFDFSNESICSEVFGKLSHFIMLPKMKESISELYAFNYRPNSFEAKVKNLGWGLFDPEKEYKRQTLLADDKHLDSFWRMTQINQHYRFSSSYPETFITPSSVSDSVVQHAGKFRSKQRVPAVVYKHGKFGNGNVIARCLQPLVGLNFQNRSLQDEKLIEEIFESQRLERNSMLDDNSEYRDQPQKNLIVDLRPVTNAMAQHAMGAGTENIDNYRGKPASERNDAKGFHIHKRGSQSVDKIFCNIENIHVVRDSLNKLTNVLSELEKKPRAEESSNLINRKDDVPSLQLALTKTQWLHHLFLILQAVDRITKSVHLNNTNVLIHCSDGWDRTSQVSALSQLCLDPYFRTIEGFMVLIEKEWLSFGFKFATRSDQSGCIGALLSKSSNETRHDWSENNLEPRTLELFEKQTSGYSEVSPANDKGATNSLLEGSARNVVTSLFQRAATHIKKTAHGVKSVGNLDNGDDCFQSVYSGSNERSPVFHQFLDCVYQVHRQMPSKFEFNTRFLKRLLYHSYSCQYGSFLFDSELERRLFDDLERQTTSVWAYFLSRRGEFTNALYDEASNNDVLFFNFSEVKWWYELYGRSDEEMNGLSNSLEKKFARLNLQRRAADQDTQEPQ